MSAFRDEVSRARNELLVRLLFDAFTTYRDQLFARMREMGFGTINMQHSMVLRAMDPGGSLMRDVTRRSGASRQVIARIVKEMCDADFLTVSVDPNDRRNQIVRFTRKGRRLARASITAGHRVELSMAGRLGPKGLGELRTLLQTLNRQPAGELLESASRPRVRPKAE